MFYSKGTTQVKIAVCDIPVCDFLVKSKDHMNAVGVMSDSKLTWAKHILIQNDKAKSSK